MAAKKPAAKKPATKKQAFTIDDAIAFFHAFLEAKRAMTEANLSGSSAFPKRQKELNAMLADDCQDMTPRKDVAKLTDEFKEANANSLKKLVRGELFWVEQHKVGNRNAYCGYVSASTAPSTISHVYWVDSAKKINAIYFQCFDCKGTGKLKGKTCSECHGRGWFRDSGIPKLMPVAKSVAAKKLVRPTHEASAAYYDRA